MLPELLKIYRNKLKLSNKKNCNDFQLFFISLNFWKSCNCYLLLWNLLTFLRYISLPQKNLYIFPEMTNKWFNWRTVCLWFKKEKKNVDRWQYQWDFVYIFSFSNVAGKILSDMFDKEKLFFVCQTLQWCLSSLYIGHLEKSKPLVSWIQYWKFWAGT